MDTNQCVHCGLCLTACPTYGETGVEMESPRGRLVLLNQWAHEPALHNPQTATWLDDCLDCRACEAVCPAHVPTGHLVEAWRSSMSREHLLSPSGSASPPFMPLLTRMIGSPRGLRLLQCLSRISRGASGAWLLTRFGAKLPSTVHQLRLGLPRTIARRLSRYETPRRPATGETVMLFVGCIMDAIYADTNRHTADLLGLANLHLVIPPQQRCCGALHLHSGDRETTRQWAQTNIQCFEESGASRVAVNAAGCGTTLREYDTLFDDDPTWASRARRFQNAVVDISVLLQEKSLPPLPERGETVTVHDPCHLVHAQGIRRQPRDLLRGAGYTISEMEDSDRCCGSAGVYNLTHAEMSEALVTRKVASIPDKVSKVAAANPGCILQIQSGVNRLRTDSVSVIHPVDLLWAAYRDAGYLTSEGSAARGPRN